MVEFYDEDTKQELELWTEWVAIPEKGDFVHLESGDYKVLKRRVSHALVQVYVYKANFNAY